MKLLILPQLHQELMEMSNQEAFSINEENLKENKDINEENNADDLQTRKSLYEQLKENKGK